MNNRVTIILDDDDDVEKPTIYTVNDEGIVVIDDSECEQTVCVVESEDEIILPPTSSNSYPTRTIPGSTNRRSFPGPTGTVPGPTGTVPGPTGTVPGPTNKRSIPGLTNQRSIPGPTRTGPTNQQSIPGPTRSVRSIPGEGSLKRKRSNIKVESVKRKKNKLEFDNHEPSITFAACSRKDADPPDSPASTSQNTARNVPSTCLETSCSHDEILNTDSKIICPVCSQVFRGDEKSSNFLMHYRTAHLVNCMYCSLCNLCDNPGTMKQKHIIKAGHKARCPFCPFGSTDQWTFKSLMIHFRLKHCKKTTSKYICYYSDCRKKSWPQDQYMSHYLIKHEPAMSVNLAEVSTQCCNLCKGTDHVHLSEENVLAHYMEKHGKVLTKEVYEVFERSEHASMIAGIDKVGLPSDAEINFPSTSSNKPTVASNGKKSKQSSSHNKTYLESSFSKLPPSSSDKSILSALPSTSCSKNDSPSSSIDKAKLSSTCRNMLSNLESIFGDFFPSSNDINVSASATYARPSSNNGTNRRSSLTDKNNLPLASSDKLNAQSSQNNKTNLESSSVVNDGQSTTTNQSSAAPMGKKFPTQMASGSSQRKNKEDQSRSSHVRDRTKSCPSSTSGKRKCKNSLNNTNCDSTNTRNDGCSTQSNNSHKRPRTKSVPVESGSSRQVLSNLSNSQSDTPQNLSKYSHIIFIDLDNWGRFFNLPYPLPSNVFVWGFCGGNFAMNKAFSVHFRILVQEKRFFQHPKCGKSKNAADFALCVQAARLDLQLPVHIPFTVLSGDKGFDELRNQLKSSARQINLVDPHHEEQDMLYGMLASIGET